MKGREGQAAIRDLGLEASPLTWEIKIATWLRDFCGHQMNCMKLCGPILFVFLFIYKLLCYSLESDAMGGRINWDINIHTLLYVEPYIKDTLHQGHRTKTPELTEPP